MVNIGEVVDYLFENCDENDDFCGDMFYVEVEYGPESEALAIEIAYRVCDEPSLIQMDPRGLQRQMGLILTLRMIMIISKRTYLSPPLERGVVRC